MKNSITILGAVVIASILFVGCGQNSNKQKELELKERELALKEKEFALDSIRNTKATVPNSAKETTNIDAQTSSESNIQNSKPKNNVLVSSFFVKNDKLFLKLNGKQFLVPKGKVEIWPIQVIKKPNTIAACLITMGLSWSAEYYAVLKNDGSIFIEEDYQNDDSPEDNSHTILLKIKNGEY